MRYFLFKLFHTTLCLRVNGQFEELRLDRHEHDNQAYPELIPDPAELAFVG